MRVKGKEYEVTQQLLDQNILCITCLSHFIVCVSVYVHVLCVLACATIFILCECEHVCTQIAFQSCGQLALKKETDNAYTG